MYNELNTEFKVSYNLERDFFWNDFFFKGITSEVPLDDFLFFEPGKMVRNSKTSSEHGNLYNLLLNELTSWKHLPLRKNSLIFTNNEVTASAFSIPRESKNELYGKLYRVIPQADANIVISPNNDIWYSFNGFFRKIGIKKLDYDLTHFNGAFREIADKFNLPNFDADIKQFTNLISAITSDKGKVAFQNAQTQQIFNSIKNNRFELAKLTDLLNPEKNGFEIKAPQTYNIKKKDNELWTDSLCILIENSKYENFREEVRATSSNKYHA